MAGGAIKWSIIDALHKLHSLVVVVVVILEINSENHLMGALFGVVKCGTQPAAVHRTCSNLEEERTIK